MRAGRAALLGFSLVFTVTLAVLAVAAELQLGPVASVMDWVYNFMARIGYKSIAGPSMEWCYMVAGSKSGLGRAVDSWGLGYMVLLDVNSTQASPDASIALNATAGSVGVEAGQPGQLFVIYANGTGSWGGGGGGDVCASPRECGLSLSWGQIYYTDALGNPASPAAGRQILIHVPVHASPGGRYGKALVIVEIHRYNPEYGTVIIDDNMAINVAYMLVGDGVEATVLWWPRDPGTYLLRAYIWNDFPGKARTWESYIEPLEKVITIS